MSSPSNETGVSAGLWWITVCAGLLLGLATAQLLWLLWRYVPLHAALFEGMGMPLSRSASVALSASNWLVRLFPFAVLVTLPLGGALLVGGAVVALKVDPRTTTVVRTVAALSLTAALALFAASALLVHAIQGVYQQAATSPAYQQSLRELDECRREKRNATQVPAIPR